jgi:hypothetical protein
MLQIDERLTLALSPDLVGIVQDLGAGLNVVGVLHTVESSSRG